MKSNNKPKIQTKTFINPELKKIAEIDAGRKTFMKKFDPHCRCSRKEAVGMKHVFEIQKEWMVPSRYSKKNFVLETLK